LYSSKLFNKPELTQEWMRRFKNYPKNPTFVPLG
jgi:hypothetical protein